MNGARFEESESRMQQRRLREAGIAARKGIPRQQRAALDKAICSRIIQLAAFQSARTVFSYSPMPGEADIRTVNSMALRLGKRVAYPDCIDATQMVARTPLDDAPWITRRLHIASPDPEHAQLVLPEEIDFVIVPCTAFDSQCHRVGMGAGYYDRYLPRCIHAFSCIAAYDEQQAMQIVRQEHDFVVDAVATQSRLYCATAGAQPVEARGYGNDLRAAERAGG